ncbi:MAG: hypothetical protein GXO32_03280 [Crenarchaeota archaeon]|nr:hypothetical protein [Thermoproteota archaeon]
MVQVYCAVLDLGYDVLHDIFLIVGKSLSAALDRYGLVDEIQSALDAYVVGSAREMMDIVEDRARDLRARFKVRRVVSREVCEVAKEIERLIVEALMAFLDDEEPEEVLELLRIAGDKLDRIAGNGSIALHRIEVETTGRRCDFARECVFSSTCSMSGDRCGKARIIARALKALLERYGACREGVVRCISRALYETTNPSELAKICEEYCR